MSGADDHLLAALAALAAALRELGAPAMIIGGIAVIARGVPRDTVDVDATVWGESLDLERLLNVLAHHRIVPRIPDATASNGFCHVRWVQTIDCIWRARPELNRRPPA